MTTLRIVQLYPDLLGITGDRGNVDVLATRARLAGHDVVVESVGLGDPSPAEADVIVIGNGPLSAVRAVRDDLAARSAWLSAKRSGGASLFAVGGGAELLTEGIDLLDGTSVDGLGMLAARVTRTRTRKVGYVVAETVDGRLVGFEDHASEWSVPDAAARYGRVAAGVGGIAGGFETVAVDGVWATNVQGPALPLNPQLADAILLRALGDAYATTGAHEAIDVHARAARAEIERLAASKHFTAIKL
ncbi:type 1 glutamine amidotransferase [Microbacterium aoyamense]|uniref:Lipid II isoglutaminyl synthase (glutamine-hydrolyzing) subunit GatD n=1 Tax=Microbacterium aoyamense TaxID=344166 RepID=A0ABN2P5G2_9MICO|nr:glutamine amidotransferase [Microbacterium aoyamense]